MAKPSPRGRARASSARKGRGGRAATARTPPPPPPSDPASSAPEPLAPARPPEPEAHDPKAAPSPEAAPAPLSDPGAPTELSAGEGAEHAEDDAPLAEERPRRPKGVAPELPLRVESLLFAAGKPVNVHDLVASLSGDADHVQVQRALRKLQRAYAHRNTSLEVRKAGDAWALQVRSDYLQVARTVTPLDIPAHTLRVLALVAYHQPIRQSLLARMVGEVAYSEVKTLRDLGFLHAIARASTLELTTTSRFAEYFGLESTEKGKIRELLEKRLGINPTATPPSPPPSDGPSGPGGEPPAEPTPSEGEAGPLPAE